MAEKKTKAEIEQENEMLRQMLAMLSKGTKTDDKEAMRKRDVTITNLCEGTLILKVDNLKHLTFTEQFEQKKITRQEARSIVYNMPNTYLQGFFILDKNGQEEVADMFSNYELEQMTNTTLSAEQLKNIFSYEPDVIEDIYRRVNATHKKFITDKLRTMIEEGQIVDIRIKGLMTDISGINYFDMMPIENNIELSVTDKAYIQQIGGIV